MSTLLCIPREAASYLGRYCGGPPSVSPADVIFLGAICTKSKTAIAPLARQYPKSNTNAITVDSAYKHLVDGVYALTQVVLCHDGR